MSESILIQKLQNLKDVEETLGVNYPIEISHGNNGFDLRTTEHLDMVHGKTYVVKTGLRIKLPEGYCGYVTERSGLGIKYGVSVHARLIDTNYRGEIAVIISCKMPVTFEIGDRVAQIVFFKTLNNLVQVDSIDTDTNRGEKGFGSSGVK